MGHWHGYLNGLSGGWNSGALAAGEGLHWVAHDSAFDFAEKVSDKAVMTTNVGETWSTRKLFSANGL